MLRTGFACLFAIFYSLDCLSQRPEGTNDTAVVKIPRITSQVTLDGRIDETAWLDIQPFPMTVQRPVFGMDPTHPTEILMGFDDEYVYAAGRFYDSEPDQIQSPYRKRDNIGLSSDWFWVGLDCFNDNENALVF
ncbi:MAG TPA: hypothetical protein ENO05_03085, partial [Bacteroides sp.]|nr:hypothetical protein [Bacteroides sp.]